MKLNDLYPSNWLKAADIGDEPLILTIDRIEVAEMQDGNRKPAVYFREEGRGLILNKTNANTIAAVYGDDTDSWVGHKIQLLAVPVDFQGKTVEAIRIRARAAKPAAKPAYRNPNDVGNDDPPRGNVRSGVASYGEAKGRAPVAPRVSPQDDLDDSIPFSICQ
jgi:hypothetical protein